MGAPDDAATSAGGFGCISLCISLMDGASLTGGGLSCRAVCLLAAPTDRMDQLHIRWDARPESTAMTGNPRAW